MKECDEELEKYLAAYRGSSKARLVMNIMRQWIRGLNWELKPFVTQPSAMYSTVFVLILA